MAPVSNERKIQNPKNRQTKVHLVFDEKARKQFLTGFRKRKLERKRKFQEKLKQELKVERKRLQTELREKIKKSASMKVVPEIEHLMPEEEENSEDKEAKVYELPEHTVTIQTIGDSQMQDENLYLGPNRGTHEENGEEEDTQEILDRKRKLKELNREATKKLQKTKAYKKQMQLVRTKSKKKAKAKRVQKKNVKGKRKK